MAMKVEGELGKKTKSATSYDPKWLAEEIRRMPPDQHPVEFGLYVIPTPFSDSAADFVGDVIQARLPGCLVYGTSRFGKSHGMVQVVMDLHDRFGDALVVIAIQVEGHNQSPSMAQHYTDQLEAVNHLMPGGGIGTDRRKRFREFIVGEVAESGQRRLVLIYDDSQFLWPDQYRWLMCDFNYWGRFGIKPTYVMVGEETLLQQRTQFINEGARQLVYRFMVRKHEYPGIRNQEEMELTCDGYDDCEHPEGSGISYTAHFFPAAFQNGWRLRKVAGQLYAQYEAVRMGNGFARNGEIGLQYFMPVIEAFLTEFRNGEILDPCAGNDWWTSQILKAGYLDAEESTLIDGTAERKRRGRASRRGTG